MQLACPHCDLVVQVPRLKACEVAKCPQCKSQLSRANINNDKQIVALSLTAIILLLSSVFYPFISFASNGVSQTITLPDAARMLFNYDHPLLGFFIDLSIIVLPLIMLLLLLPLHMGLLAAIPKKWGRRLLKITFGLGTYVMSEIFLVGVLVSMVKIMSMADVSFGPSFWAYCGFVVSYVATISHINKRRLWRFIGANNRVDVAQGVRAIDVQLRACHQCHQLSYEKICPRCHSKTSIRDEQSVQKAAAWLLTSVVLYIPANALPIMYTTSLGDREPSTIISGILLLWDMGSYPIAAIIFLASVVVPIAKAMVLATLCYLVYRRASKRSVIYTRLYQVTEFIGKWSMIDVFVVAVLVALVQLGNLMLVEPGLGTLCFAGMVLCQMNSAHAFDPRLIWDNPTMFKREIHD